MASPGNATSNVHDMASRARHKHANTAPTPEPVKHFSIFNVRGLKTRTAPNKVPFINDILYHDNQIFSALTETSLRDHLDAEVNIDGYTIYR